MKRTQIYLAQNQISALRGIAQRKKTTVSRVIREILAEKIEKPRLLDYREKHETLFEAAKRINALGKGGPKDLASRVDYYLYGKV